MGALVDPLLVADFSQMNFRQMHERLRQELLRRIERGSVSVSLLARQTGLGQSHLSNFLRSRRQLSLDALDRVLAAQRLTAGDLLPTHDHAETSPGGKDFASVPIVSHAVALFEPVIRPSAVHSTLPVPAHMLQSFRARSSSSRRAWQRFVAVRISSGDALAMEPLALADGIALLDRQYTSLMPYRPNKANLYAVRHGAHLTLRYVDFLANRLVLRPHNINFPVDLVEVGPGESPNDLITGRVALILNAP
jgi:transcriptional regulator with XRE-family HTH domain